MEESGSNTVAIFWLVIIVGSIVLYYIYKRKQKKKAQERHEAWLDDIKKELVRFEEGNTPEVKQPDIRLQKTEDLYLTIRDCIWMEHRKVRTGRVAGHGVTGRVKLAKGVYYRYGAGRIASESVDQMTEIDRGDMYVTSKRFFFRGMTGNKQVPHNKSVGVIPYNNGFDIDKETGKKPFIRFDFHEHPKAMAIVLWASHNR